MAKFVMLVFAAALTMFNFVHTRASNEDQFDSEHVVKVFSEDDMTPDFTEQLGRHDHTRDIKKRQEEKYEPPQNEVKTTIKPVAEKRSPRKLSDPIALGRNAPGRNALVRSAPGHNVSGRNASDTDEKRHILQEETDVVDREDHVTQYLSDQMVNTDSEITSLQASDAEDERGDSLELKEDSFFAFLTGQEKPVEIEGAWSRPRYDLLPRIEDPAVNVVSGVLYKD